MAKKRKKSKSFKDGMDKRFKGSEEWWKQKAKDEEFKRTVRQK